MKTFLALYMGSASPEERAAAPPLSKETEAAGMTAWGEWVAKNAATIVDAGGPLGRTKKASNEGLSDTSNAVAAYVIVRAESHEAAARLFEGHPHFSIFPGDSVEIMERLPIPGI